jgi:hypothetical protein
MKNIKWRAKEKPESPNGHQQSKEALAAIIRYFYGDAVEMK